eukprot:8232003-Pyramimonas_sp.AAC.1
MVMMMMRRSRRRRGTGIRWTTHTLDAYGEDADDDALVVAPQWGPYCEDVSSGLPFLVGRSVCVQSRF